MREPRKFSDLRPVVVEKKADADSIEQVVGRIAGTRDGQLMLAWMRDEAVVLSPLATDDALREANGVRVFVKKLRDMALA